MKLFNLHLSPGDPFEASYYTASETDAAPALTNSMATPSSLFGESPKLSLYLAIPKNQATISRPKKFKTDATLSFRFEVYPKDANSTFELLFKNEVVTQMQISGNRTGIHELSIPFPKAGLYQWSVKVNDITSELRTLILRD